MLPLENNGNPMRGIAASPDGTRLALASDTGGVAVLDTRTFERVGEPLRFGAHALAFSPDGTTLALGGFAGSVGHVRLVDARTLKQLADVRLDRGAPNRIAFTRDGSRLAVVESIKEGASWVTIRDATTLRQLGSRIEPEGFTGRWLSQLWTDPSIALTPDGSSLVTTSEVGELTWWDLANHKRTRTLKIADGYRALALSPDGRSAAIGLDDGIQLIDLRTLARRASRGTLASSPIWLQFAPDGTSIVSTSRDGTVTIWDVATVTPRESLRGHSDSVWQPVYSPDGRTLYTTSSDGSAIVWDLSRTRRFGRPFTFTHDQGPYEWPDTHPGEVQPGRPADRGRPQQRGDSAPGLADARSGRCAAVETGGEVIELTFSPDGRTLAASHRTRQMTVWDIESRSLRWERAGGPYAGGLSISADGKTLATGAVDGVTLWDVATGAALGRIGDSSGGGVGAVAFSPTEPLVAFVRGGWVDGGPVEGGGDAEIWDVSRRSRVASLKVDTVAGNEAYVLGWVVAFSPDGRTLATGGADHLVHLWDVRTGTLIRELEQNVGNAVWSLEFSPDGSVLAMSGGDPYVALWDVATGAQLGPRVGGFGSRETRIDLSPDGRRLLVTHGDGKGAVLDVDPTMWARRACTLAGRTLTRAEWAEFLPGRPYEPACAS